MRKVLGLSVIEVIIAIVIIAICALSIASLFQEVLRGSPDIKRLTIAASLSEEVMESALADGFNITNNSGSYSIGNQTYNYVVTVYNVTNSSLDTPTAAVTNYKHINVTIIYGQGSNRNITLESIVTKHTE
ncbi:MAG: hypothetical protein PHH69_06945 [Candidatus Omnitrophica bacterium]|nr:hypothetical protein [Candidatus Omnitrophota bacterium]MDD5611243.1 hypothetical protein [Candidatus Omnitrophota bacterium]